MKYFELNMSIDKWMHQNDAECLEFFEGCLLDNYLLYCKRGNAFVYEHYLNSNSSNYRVMFFTHKEIKENPERYNRQLSAFINRMDSANKTA